MNEERVFLTIANVTMALNCVVIGILLNSFFLLFAGVFLAFLELAT